jgi:regulation of enolase protein 1 (concanavalin A-like superfamily)
VTSVDDIDDWTKAGVMIRDGAGASARHAFLFVTPAGRNGVAFQRRTVAGGFTTHTGGPALAAPVWLQLSRRGDIVEASYRVSVTDPWQRIDADSIPKLPDTVLVGLAVTSHHDGVLAAGTFDGFSIETETDASVDVGSVAVAGDSEDDGSVIRVRGSGADIWSTADAFHWRYTSVSGDFDAVVLVTSVDAVRAWTKAGLMVRAGLQPDAAHMSLFATPGHGVAFQRRRDTGGISFNTGGPAVAAPVWLRLSRRGSVVYASYRATDNDPWTFIDADEAPSFGDVLLVGLAVSSHADGLVAEADFEQFTIAPMPAFTDGDVGSVSVPGMMATDSIVTSITASGADIWNGQDAFHFYRTSWHGDGSITARVLGLVLTAPWAKAGVMFRSSLDPASPHVMLVVTGSEGLSLQSRSDANGESQQVANGPGSAPTWLRLTRSGDTFSAYSSPDGASWTLLGATRAVLGDDVYVGLAVTSHDDSTATRADFDHISAVH